MKAWIKNLLEEKRDECDIEFLEGVCCGIEYALIHAISEWELGEIMEYCRDLIEQARTEMAEAMEEIERSRDVSET